MPREGKVAHLGEELAGPGVTHLEAVGHGENEERSVHVHEELLDVARQDH